MNIFITGATGFVGKNLTELFLKKGYDISCLVRSVSKAKKLFSHKVQLIEGDLTYLPTSLNRYLLNADVVCHLAACVASSKTKDFFDINVQGTQNLCNLLIKSKKLRKLVYLSSLSVIGRDQKQPITESALCQPYSPYGQSKLKAEKIMTSFHAEFSHAQLFILRAPVIYGEGQMGMINGFFRKIENGTIVLFGNGKNIRSMCYIGNLNDAIITLIEKNEIFDQIEVINIADREQITLGELVLLIAKKFGTNVRIKYFSTFISNAGFVLFKFFNLIGFNFTRLFVLATASTNICCKVEKALLMGIPLTYKLEDGIENTVQWLKKTEN